MAQSAYITDLNERTEQDTLRQYVDKLQSKIDYAKWKQSLVLSYNYMPLQSIKQKIDTQRRNYIKKMEDEENRLRKTVENKQMITQLELFRQFSQKLANKMKEIELKIDNEQMKIKVLSTEADDKRLRLKEILKQNMHLTKTFFNQQGVTTKADLVRLSRTHSLRETKFKTISHKNTNSNTTNFESIPSVRSARNSYDECVQSIVKALRGMNSSEDVQAGIYLDIMSKKSGQKIPKPRYSTKSNICHTLMDRYGSLNTHHRRQNEDFDMSWETFSQLNWKQIMGIILVKDPQVVSLRNLLQMSQ